MPARYHKSRPARNPRGAETFDNQHLVRAQTSRGEWGSVYAVADDGSCHLVGRTTRWEPLNAVRARVTSYLGGRKEARP